MITLSKILDIDEVDGGNAMGNCKDRRINKKTKFIPGYIFSQDWDLERWHWYPYGGFEDYGVLDEIHDLSEDHVRAIKAGIVQTALADPKYYRKNIKGSVLLRTIDDYLKDTAVKDFLE